MDMYNTAVGATRVGHCVPLVTVTRLPLLPDCVRFVLISVFLCQCGCLRSVDYGMIYISFFRNEYLETHYIKWGETSSYSEDSDSADIESALAPDSATSLTEVHTSEIKSGVWKSQNNDPNARTLKRPESLTRMLPPLNFEKYMNKILVTEDEMDNR